MSVVQASKGLLKPVSKTSLAKPSLYAGLPKQHLVAASKIDWDKYAQHYDHIRQAIERTIIRF
jgi:hypothetical protein